MSHTQETRKSSGRIGQQAGPAETLTPAATAADQPLSTGARYVAAGLRLSLGWVFLWAFLDKTFGLGFATEKDGSWLNGGSPTEGFLSFAATGPFQSMYNNIAGAVWADWLFMLGLLGIGAALMLGVTMRIAAGAGALMLFLMWTAVLPPENNPFMDDHLIYAGTLVLLAMVGAGRTLGLGRWWESLPIVQRNSWLK